MLAHEDLFDKAHLAHLKRSLYGRIYAYLYPRRLLTTAYAEAHRGDEEAAEEQTVRANFRQDVAQQIEQLREVYGDGERLEQIIDEAEDFLVLSGKRYAWGKKDRS
jgi:hypothetical protein